VDFELTADLRAVQQLGQEVLDPAVLVPRASGHVGDDRLDEQLWSDLAAAGITGLALGDDVGGGGQGMMALCLLLEQVGLSLARVPLLAHAVAAQAVERFGSPGLRDELLPGAVDGSGRLTLGICDAFGTLGALPLVARRADAGWVLDGDVSAVPFVAGSGAVVVAATTQDGGTIITVIDPQADGVVAVLQHTTSGLPQHELHLADVVVPDAAVVGTHELGREIRRWIWNRAVVGTSAVLLGIGTGSLQMAAEYTGVRKQFGRLIGSFQASALHAADAFIDLEIIRVATWQAAWRLDQEWPADREAAIAKYWASDGSFRVTAASQHLHGGIGLVTDYPVHRYFLWAKHHELSYGSSAWHSSELGLQLAAAD
jgi:alkylation response protein AidB-like acyl-CoA dehydrogenase